MNQRGSIEIIVVFGMIALLASAALVADFGTLALTRIKIQNALSNAALSGAHYLTISETTARSKALEYYALNGENAANASVTITNNSRKLEISASKVVTYTFGKALGFKDKTVIGKATAIIGPIKSMTGGVRPLGVEKIAYAYGDEIVLKENAGSGVYGNYGSISLGGTGNSIYTNNLLYGYSGKVSIDDVIPTEPGNKASAVNQLKTLLSAYPETFNNYTNESNRLWTLPLVEFNELSGRTDVKIVGFAKFFIEDIELKSGQAQITGRFVEYVDLGEVDTSLEITGLYGVQLIR